MIWFNKEASIQKMEDLGKGTLIEYIGIEWIELGKDYLKARMPVDRRTIQPYGLLHGGASCVLAESMGSMASALVIDPLKNLCVGIEINANHIRSAREGFVTGTVRPIHLGATSHVWDIRILNEEGKLICISRLTVAVLAKKNE